MRIEIFHEREVAEAEQWFRHETELLIRLFFEEPDIVFSTALPEEGAPPVNRDSANEDSANGDAERPGLAVAIALRRGHGEAVVVVNLSDAAGRTIRRCATEPYPVEHVESHRAAASGGGMVLGDGAAAEPAPVRFPAKIWKRPVQMALLEALSEWTGIRQPWGVLTGVRPVKLYHRYLEQGEHPGRIASLLAEQFLIAPEKIRLMEQITRRQLEVMPDLYRLGREVSVYVGIPFCPTKCAYCTFPAYSIQGRDGSVEAFLQGLHEEIAQVGEWLLRKGFGVTAVYVGGGTPTSITADQLDALLGHMARHLPGRDRWREWTVEAGRPDTITPEKLDVLKKWGVDRISINPQSFTQSTLESIGRHHTIEETLEAYELARRMGMTNINMDLIIGLPGESVEHFRRSLEQAGRLRPESLTVHTLSFKRASAMTQNKSRYRVAGRDEVTEMVRMSQAWTAEHGYVPYYLYRQKNILGNQENVGYALPGKECLYNIVIMEERQTILGLGCGASSKIIAPSGKITRYANPKEPGHYIRHYREYIEGKLKQLDEQLFAPA